MDNTEKEKIDYIYKKKLELFKNACEYLSNQMEISYHGRGFTFEPDKIMADIWVMIREAILTFTDELSKNGFKVSIDDSHPIGIQKIE